MCLDVKNEFTDMYNKLRHRFFLSSMMDVTDGAFCAERSGGCAMVQLGAYLAEPPAYGKEPYFLPPNTEECIEFLAEENRKAKASRDVFTCLNFATPRLEWALETAECFHRADGDLVELNVHGGYEPYLRIGKVRAMVLSENRNELFRWVEALTGLEIPLIVKFREGIVNDYPQVVTRLLKSNVFAVHFNIRDDRTRRPDFNFAENIKRDSPPFLLVSGFIRSVKDARILFEKGADVVGIAEPTIEDPKYIETIAREFEARQEARP